MKRRLMSLVATGVLVLSTASCGGGGGTTTAAETTAAETTTAETTTAETTAEETTAAATESPAADLSLDGLTQYMLDAEVISGEPGEVAAEMIGAVAGVSYADPDVELYEYDDTSDAYTQILEEGTVELQGFDMTLSVAAINGSYVLIFPNEGEPFQDVVDTFLAYGR